MKEAVRFFDDMTISYTYENGWGFTNYFKGTLRITEVAARGILHEEMNIQELRDGIYMISWEDEERGFITQVIDIPNRKLMASVPIDGKVEIWSATITQFVKGKA